MARLLIPLVLLLPLSVLASARLENPAASQLSEQDMAGVRELLNKMAGAFKNNDAEACSKLFSGDAQRRERLFKSLQREFQQARYTKFEILDVLADDTLRPNHHTVDVHFQFALLRGGKAPEIENTTVCNFVIQKLDDGSFAIVNSSFFEGLGLKSSMDNAVDLLLAIMALFALMAFWVWMGFEAWRMRPRNRPWRAVVMLPVLGALIFFFVKYLPRLLNGNPAVKEVVSGE